ncbi:MAG TPA: carboxypeptidase-like regulatory domain-containing protein [Lacipirellula sp.]
MIRRIWSHVLPFAFVVLAGCGGSGEGMLPVTGTVKNADGSPVTGEVARVVFQPTDGRQAASASIESDGSFAAMTQTPGDGMAPGQYKVVLNVLKDYRANIIGVPQEYADASTTPLTITVDEGNTHFDLVVEP